MKNNKNQVINIYGNIFDADIFIIDNYKISWMLVVQGLT
jgi:hypothetical protein